MSAIDKYHVGHFPLMIWKQELRYIQVHFAVRASDSQKPEVVIRAQSKYTDHIFELIPREKLQENLPRLLREDHVHWLNLGTSVVEIRPIKEPWKQSLDNWTLDFKPGQSRVIKGDNFLVNKQSLTWAMVSSCLRCLDDPENLIITVSPVDSVQNSPSLRLSASLPRYGLSFFVNDTGQLESHDFKDMVCDEDQCIGTLHGLVNRLVLCPKAHIEADVIPKCILIPHGHPSDQRGNKVYVHFPSFGPVNYFVYQTDSELGCLKGIVSTESRLYLAHLHALTGSGCRADPLTGRTGIEEAISLIWLAGTRQRSDECSFTSQSPQIRLAFAKIQDHTDDESTEDALRREACLFSSELAASIPSRGKGPLESLDKLLHQRPAPVLRERIMLPRYNPGRTGVSFHMANALRQLFSSLRSSQTAPPFQSQYVSRLHSSAHRFQTTDHAGVTCGSTTRGTPNTPNTERLCKHYVQCRVSYTESLNVIKMALGPETEFERILDQCGQWPRITPFILFRCLSSTSPTKLPESWKKCLISLALLALDVQRARRLLRFSLDNLEEELCKELENEGCDGWDASEHPDWLLIQVCAVICDHWERSSLLVFRSGLSQLQGNFLIRRVQACVAKEMMSPRSGKNTVMQVNMGEGKTSVILPICAATLADRNRLVRIIVPSPLIPQTLRVLTDRLGGLIDKPIYHMTFSRDDTKDRFGYIWHLGVGKIEMLHALVRKCRDECGIIVMQPEHVLSLKLACVEMQLLETGIENKIGTKPTSGVSKRGFKHVLDMLRGSLRVIKSVSMVVVVKSLVMMVLH